MRLRRPRGRRAARSCLRPWPSTGTRAANATERGYLQAPPAGGDPAWLDGLGVDLDLAGVEPLPGSHPVGAEWSVEPEALRALVCPGGLVPLERGGRRRGDAGSQVGGVGLFPLPVDRLEGEARVRVLSSELARVDAVGVGAGQGSLELELTFDLSWTGAAESGGPGGEPMRVAVKGSYVGVANLVWDAEHHLFERVESQAGVDLELELDLQLPNAAAEPVSRVSIPAHGTVEQAWSVEPVAPGASR